VPDGDAGWDIDFVYVSIKTIYTVYGEYFDTFGNILKKYARLWKIIRFITRQCTIREQQASAHLSGAI
jgi:hypothetical protein